MSRTREKLTVSMQGLVILCITILTGTVSLHAQETVFGSVINISNNASTFDTSPSVAASGDNIYIVWSEVNVENPANSRILFRYSHDNGNTWIPPLEEIPVELGIGEVEPEVAAFGDHVYVTYKSEISVDVDQLNFRASHDKGLTWNPALSDPAIDLSSTEASANISPWNIQFHNLAAYNDNVYVVWDGNCPGFNKLIVQFRGSTDNGDSWDPPLNHTPYLFPFHGDDSIYPDVAAYGTSVYVVWNAQRYGQDMIDEIFFARSTDSGATFQNEINISNATLKAYKPHIIAYGNDAYIVWGQIFMGSNLELVFRRASGNETSWFPLLSDPPARLSEHSRFDWDIAGSEEDVHVVVESEIGSPEDYYYRSILFRESSDGGTTWNPSTLEDPRSLIGSVIENRLQSRNPRITATDNYVYVTWEQPVPWWIEDTQEILLRIGYHTPLGSTLESWSSERQIDQHWASLNESPSLPLKLVWQRTLPDAVKTTPVRHKLIDKVFVGSDDHKIYALDPETGSIVWDLPTPGAVSTSPTVEVGKGYEYLFATSEDGTLFRLNADTGEIIWKIGMQPSPLISSPITDGGIVYYVSQDDEIGSVLNATWAFDSSTLWEMPLNAVSSCTPMEAFGTIYVGIPENNSTLLGVSGLEGDIVFRATDDHPTAGSYTSGVPDLDTTDFNPDSYRILVGTRDEIVSAVRSNDGQTLGEEELPGYNDGPVTGMALTQYRSTNSLVVSQLAQLHALGPSLSNPIALKVRWSRRFNRNLMTSNYKTPKPLIWGNYVFHVEEQNRLVAVSLADGSERWSYTLDAPTVSSPSVDGESLYIGDNNGNVYRFMNLFVFAATGESICLKQGTDEIFTADFESDQVGSPPAAATPGQYGPAGASLQTYGTVSNREIVKSTELGSAALKIARGSQEGTTVYAIVGDDGSAPHTAGVYYIDFRAHGQVVPVQNVAGLLISVRSAANESALILKLYDGAYHLWEDFSYTALAGSYDPSEAHSVHIELDLDARTYSICINNEVVLSQKPLLTEDFGDLYRLQFFAPRMASESDTVESVYIVDDIRITK